MNITTLHTSANEDPADADLVFASETASQRAIDAMVFIEERLSALNKQDFENIPANRSEGYGGIPISADYSYLDCLRNELRSAFAEIDLAKQFPGSALKSGELLDLLINGSGIQFFGTNGHVDNDTYLHRSSLLDKVVADNEIQFANQLFLVLKNPTDSNSDTLKKWLEKAKVLVSQNGLGTSGTLSTSQQSRCIRTLHLLGIVLQSQHLSEVATKDPEGFEMFRQFIDGPLAENVRSYGRRRFIEDGAMRDRSLPILSAAKTIIPSLDFQSVGVTSQKTLQKMALNHARGLADLVEVIDAPMADTNLARKAIGQIIDYRVQPFYIGSKEIREKGSIPCGADQELEMILKRADFFGSDGHRRGTTYRKRIKMLEQLFLSPSSLETRDFLFAIKAPEEWIEYFEKTLVGSNQNEAEKPSRNCLAAIQKGAISPTDLKNLFLARCMLSHTAFDTLPELKKRRDALKTYLQEQAPTLALEHFKTQPQNWNKVDLAFVEISKLVPEFKLVNLSIPTYRQYLGQKDNYESVLLNLPDDFLRLTNPESHLMISNEAALFQSDFVYRIGKFNKRLSPGFIKDINEKLGVILDYRNSQFTPPDRRIRPGFASAGRPIRELMVLNRNHPNENPGNPQLHDLLEGPDGGLGGLGALFISDPKGYEMRESALDAIASSEELLLADTLFTLAIDAGIEEPTPEDKATAAKRWLNYFRKTQSLARFHSTPEELSNAIRGAFVCRLVVQSTDFMEAVERSAEEGVGSAAEVSSVLESTLTSQVRIMNNVLSAVDPSTALNKNIETIKKRWYEVKAWHTESNKWLETILADPVLMGEISRIRSLSRIKSKAYGDVAPAITDFEHALKAVEPRILAERHSEKHNEMFSPLDFANLVMGELLTLEKQPNSTVLNPELTSTETLDMERRELSLSVTRQLFLDVRKAVNAAGFEELSKATSLNDFPLITTTYSESLERRDRSEDAIVHAMLLQQLKGAVANAKGRIEAERTTDLKTLEEHSIRAARADRLFYSGDRDRYSLLIDPSLLLHEWNNRHKVEIIAEFRTVETRAQAQTQIFRFRKERERLEQDRKFLEDQQKQLDARLAQAKKWSVENDMKFDPDAVVSEMLAMEDTISSLKGEISVFQDMEEKYREHHFNLAQQLHSYRVGHAISERDRKKTQHKEMLLAKAEQKNRVNPEPDFRRDYEARTTYKSPSKKTAYKKPAYRKPTPKPVVRAVPKRPTTSRPASIPTPRSRSYTSQRSSSSSLIQKIFGRNRRR